jgi:hypothetical protein
MAGKSKKKVFVPKMRLAELVARAGGVHRDIALEGAAESIEGMREQADTEIRKAITAIEGIVFAKNASDTLTDDEMLGVLRHGDHVVTLAGTFAYTALDAAARSMCDVADGLLRAGMNTRQPVAVHVQTMHLLAPGNMKLSAEHAEKMLSELAKVTAFFNFRSLSTTPVDEGDDLIALAAGGK